ncbi:hypothetical protein SDC9_178459 [bioreactor metagenome]|uniref:Uncharacterized protein n=1 Tax=bioreactor metagenome TaxID=1076179 RepID=A0A645GVZ7_9ZZZZ
MRLINNHELIGDAASADITERLHDDAAGTHQVAAAPVLMAHVQVAQHLQRIMDGLHPGSEFLVE